MITSKSTDDGAAAERPATEARRFRGSGVRWQRSQDSRSVLGEDDDDDDDDNKGSRVSDGKMGRFAPSEEVSRRR